MTKHSLSRSFMLMIMLIAFLIIIGIIISIFDSTSNRLIFTTFKDLIPLVLGLIAAYLSFCVQRRFSYQQQLRVLWSKLVEAIEYAVQYTNLDTTNVEQYENAKLKLSIAIEEIRGVFCNIFEHRIDNGLYPFEPIKDIFKLIKDLNYGEFYQKQNVAESQKKIFALWKDVRKAILKEFDREPPSFPHCHWINEENNAVYKKYNIPKTPS